MRGVRADGGATETREIARQRWSEYFDALSREAVSGPVARLSPDSQTTLAPITITVDGPEDVRVFTIEREPEIEAEVTEYALVSSPSKT